MCGRGVRRRPRHGVGEGAERSCGGATARAVHFRCDVQGSGVRPAVRREARRRSILRQIFGAFPDLSFSLRDSRSCPRTTVVAVHLHMTGTMSGPLEPPGFAPTHAPISVPRSRCTPSRTARSPRSSRCSNAAARTSDRGRTTTGKPRIPSPGLRAAPHRHGERPRLPATGRVALCAVYMFTDDDELAAERIFTTEPRWPRKSAWFASRRPLPDG